MGEGSILGAGEGDARVAGLLRRSGRAAQCGRAASTLQLSSARSLLRVTGGEASTQPRERGESASVAAWARRPGQTRGRRDAVLGRVHAPTDTAATGIQGRRGRDARRGRLGGRATRSDAWTGARARFIIFIYMSLSLADA